MILSGTGSTGTGSTGTTVLTDGEVCTGLALEPEPLVIEEEITTTTEVEVPGPVALYIVLDNSGSMDDSGSNTSNTKWEEAVEALTNFVEAPESEGIDVALQYFHPVGVGNDPDECSGEAHAIPAVDMGRLPDQANAIVDSLNDTGPNGNTPTVGSLIGGITYCAEFQAAHPDEQCVVVLVTDGQPNACGLSSDCGSSGGGSDCVDPNSESVLTPIAAAGASSGVVTFTIGMAGVTTDGFVLLDALAVAGGSDCTPGAAGDEACDVTTSGAEGFLAALNAIRDSVTVMDTITTTVTTTQETTLPCEWGVPLPPAGQELDPTMVNVQLNDGVSPPALVPNVPTQAECATAPGTAWYYDNPAAPTNIFVCPSTCELITANTAASVDVVFGCKVVQVPR